MAYLRKERTREPPPQPQPSSNLSKSVSLLGGLALTAGGIMGSGIFFTPYSIFNFSGGSVVVALSVWIGAGLLALAGGLCYCELGCSMPESGGDYVYLHRAYGPLPAFLFVWSAIFLGRPCAQAVVTLPFAKCLVSQIFEEPTDGAVNFAAIVTTVVLGLVNSVDVKAAVRVQSFLLVFKVASLLLVVFAAFFYWFRSGERGCLFDGSSSSSHLSAGQIGMALYAALWAYDGWANLNYALGEVPNPEKILPRAIGLGLLVVIGCYVAVNVSLFVFLTKEEYLSSDATILLIGTKFLGSSTASIVVPTFMGIFCLGTANGMCLLGARLIYAASRKGQFPAFLGLIHADFATPVPAVCFHTLLCCFYILLGSFESLLEYTSVLAWIVFGLGFLSVYVLRVREPQLQRPYKVFGALPGLMILASVYLVFVPLVMNPKTFLVVLVFVPGCFVYYCVIQGRLGLLKSVNDYFLHLTKRLGKLN